MGNAMEPREKEVNGLRQSEGVFAFLTPDIRKEINDLAPVQVYPPITPLFQQGSPSKEVYFIARGLVKLQHVEQNGREIIVGLRSTDWLLGTAPVILQKPYPVTATTLTPCHLHHVRAEDFLHLIKTNAQFSWQLHQIHSHEINDQIGRLAGLRCFSARQRLEHILWELLASMEPKGTQKEIRLALPLKHWEIAQLITITPEHLSRILKQLQQERVIGWKEGQVVISDPQKLWHLPNF